MRRVHTVIGMLFVMPAIIGCQSRSPEFVLPDGDAETGQALFVSFSCGSCHTVRDLELPAPDVKGPVTVALGGSVSKLKTYSELVTSVINPSHQLVKRRRPEEISQDGESLMTVYNDVMTVTELSHIVAFLESKYKRIERPKRSYTVHTN